MNRASWARGAGLLIALGLLGGAGGAGATTIAGEPLSAASTGAPARTVEVIVGMRPGATMDEGRRLVRRHGGRVTGELRLIRSLTARMSARQAQALRTRARVASVTPDAAVEPKSVYVRKLENTYPKAVNVTTAWKDFDVTGRGVGVAVIDTGVAGHLPDFRTSSQDATSRVVASAVVNPEATTATDLFGHGTHVAGIIAGNGSARSTGDPLYGQRIGVAPGAHLVSIKVSGDDGAATLIDVIRGLQFAVDHKATFNIRVVNLSLESTQSQSYKTDPLAAAAEAAWLQGLVVVAAAGNRGTAADAVTRAPGNDPFVISVGGFDDQTTLTTSDDTIASWSSRGTTQDGFAKPDVYAPGSRVVSNLAPKSHFASACPSCIVDIDYLKAGGTSMSAPMVSGVAALMLERNPRLSPNQVKGIIKATVRTLPGGVPAIHGYQAVDMADDRSVPEANAGLVPNDLIDPTTGGIDYARSSWSRSSWSSASDGLTAGWARSSWSCSCLSGVEDVVTSRSSWSRSSWSVAWGL